MKGLNCYAAFWFASDTKKSLTLTQIIQDFFVPGGPQEPIFKKAADGLLSKSHHLEWHFTTSAVFLFVLGFVTRGRPGVFSSPHSIASQAVHFFFLCLTFFTVRLCPLERFGRIGAPAGQPF